jgi:hypothetical protein
VYLCLHAQLSDHASFSRGRVAENIKYRVRNEQKLAAPVYKHEAKKQ